jgi:cell wall-associated NlpC family hydrolase
MPTPTRQAYVDEVLTWLGTRFVHQGRLKGVGVDCAGLPIKAAQAVGLPVEDKTDYKRTPDPLAMRTHMQRFMSQIGFGELQPADIVWFRLPNDPQHLGVVIELADPIKFVHAWGYPGIMKVVRQDLDRFWFSRIHSCWRIKGLD